MPRCQRVRRAATLAAKPTIAEPASHIVRDASGVAWVDDTNVKVVELALDHLAYAALGRIVFTRDSDFLAEGVRRQRAGLSFATIVDAHQQNVSIGRCVEDLEIIALASTSDEATGRSSISRSDRPNHQTRGAWRQQPAPS